MPTNLQICDCSPPQTVVRLPASSGPPSRLLSVGCHRTHAIYDEKSRLTTTPYPIVASTETSVWPVGGATTLPSTGWPSTVSFTRLPGASRRTVMRSEEHTSELQSLRHL